MTNIVRTRKRPSTALVPVSNPCNGLQKLRLEIIYKSPNLLLPPKRELRKHSKRQIQLLKASVSEFGIVKPILVDDDDRILAGYGVFLAAKELDHELVPVTVLSHLNDEQRRIYALADNQISTLGEWNDGLLKLELGELADLDLGGNLNLDIELTGFTTCEIDQRLDAKTVEAADADAADALPSLEPVAITTPGTIWTLGHHRLLCGDALDESSFERLLAGERGQMVFADGPYNVPIAGHVSGLGKVQFREFAMATGEMSEEEFTNFLAKSFTLLARHSIDGSIHFQCMDWRHMTEMLAAGRQAYSELKNFIVWTKAPFAGMGSFYRSQHENIYAWKNGTAPHINNFGLSARFRTNCWNYPPPTNLQRTQDEDLGSHPTQKPVALVADAIRDCSKRGGIILDPFGGSGTTLIAAERTGRKARLIELDPLYCDVIVRRWQKATGKQAVDATTGESFDVRAQASIDVSSDREA